MAKRKFVSEFGLNMLAGYRFVLQQDQLDVIDATGVSPHIYMVARRPRISLKPNSMTFTPESVSGEFLKHIEGETESIPFSVPNKLGTADVTVNCQYPYTELSILDHDGTPIASGKCAALLTTFGKRFWPHLDLEVLYVGQAYGTDGGRTAADRLRKHETLQSIYAEALRCAPDQDIWLVICTFQEPMLIASFDGRESVATEASASEDTEHMHNVLHRVVREEISEQQRINFTEAALIRYFRPAYNKTYKDSFPNPAHTTYSECYDIDLNSVSVELQSDDLGTRFWSEAVAPSYLHICSFPLHSRDERVAMFDFFPDDGETRT